MTQPDTSMSIQPPKWKYKIIYGELKSWGGNFRKVASGIWVSDAGFGFVPNGKVEYVYE